MMSGQAIEHKPQASAQSAPTPSPSIGRISVELGGVEISLQINCDDQKLLEAVMRHFIGIQKLIQQHATAGV